MSEQQVLPPELRPVCPLCEGSGKKSVTGFGSKSVLQGCEICKGSGKLYLPPEELTELLTSALASLAQSEAERERLQGAIDWALGASGEFRERGANEGAYWWRTELRSRALLADKPQPAPVVTGEK